MQLRWWQYVLVAIVTAVVVMIALDAASPVGWMEEYRNRSILRSMTRESVAESAREERRRVREEEAGTTPPP